MVRSHGLKFTQMNILTVVTSRGPIQPSEVGRLLSLEKSTLSRNVALMEANGWLEVLPDEGNTQRLKVTREGRDLMVAAAPSWRKAQRRVAKMLGERATKELLQATDRIVQDETDE